MNSKESYVYSYVNQRKHTISHTNEGPEPIKGKFWHAMLTSAITKCKHNRHNVMTTYAL